MLFNNFKHLHIFVEVERLVTVSRQCARLLRLANGIPERKKWIEDRNEFRTQLESAFHSDQFVRVTELGEILHQHYLLSSQMSLSERHFYSFSVRRAEMLEQLNLLCRALSVCKEYDYLKVAAELRVKLLQLHVESVNTSGQ